jgi:tetratricopeptide (TPR) repeat protein
MARAGLWGWLACTLLLLTAAGAGAQARAGSAQAAISDKDDKEARDLFKLGKQAFDEARFERALKYFKDAYELSHRAALLSNIGTALDRLRRDREALEAYESYLAQVPDAPNRDLIQERVRIIRDAMDQAQASKQSAPQPTAAEVSAPTPEQTARAANPEPAAPQLASNDGAPADSGSTAITSRWWFWAGCGVIAAGAIAIGIAASSTGSSPSTQSPALVSAATRVREL